MLSRLFPHPVLSLTLTIVWLALVNKVTLGNLFLGAVFGVTIPVLTAPYWPNRPTLRAPLMALEYVFIVLWDIIVANVVVAAIVLFKRNDAIHSRWVVVPLDLTSAEAITVLAGTVTMTPGTVSTTLAADGSALLVHALHTDDPDEVRDHIKSRYERRLKEIFG
ncbi:MAG: Na+/H+ antiporter subunit E [Salipiger thiooxidans]|jgi:multicomponent K+:H+ antiporter subunit E|uniref:Multisubunit potassium/proton antiporter, PhaE subunit n=1 Tax=Salipiger thiooxidans TaxID=282683 RepID=A0A1G7LVF8_9RHOB|nr:MULTISPECIES: Na+/H+ antiporter subunit E [Salipiger]EEX14479.1 cation antiporter [Citreicella sp. SE45]MAU44456.1 Na+/H+ antiporter subunit E [Salipiger sp.]MBR9841105.1 Na+/H+ antiporter subunit E [Paracoccaceae bacterium]MBN8190176.1 Na+/H+ antiporter subunit E [Salipiger thiooxidans]MCA0851025.1 Na+/H+ antiporter subunit E [Salipiger thiooxidans]